MKVFKIIIIAIAVITALGLYINRDYKWQNKIKKENLEIGLQLYEENKQIGLIRPWSWFKTPTQSLTFYDPNILMFDSLMIVSIAGYSLNLPIKEYYYYRCFDCKNFTQAITKEQDKLKSLIENRDEWFYIKDKSDEEYLIVTDFCKKYKTYISLDMFGNEIELNHYLMSGQYSIDNQLENGWVISLINKEPYKIKSSDKKIIDDGIETWFRDNYNKAKINTENYTYLNMKYKNSQTIMYYPTDIFSISVPVIIDNKDSSVNLECTFSNLFIRNDTSDIKLKVLTEIEE
jgi:hypothetical protein